MPAPAGTTPALAPAPRDAAAASPRTYFCPFGIRPFRAGCNPRPQVYPQDRCDVVAPLPPVLQLHLYSHPPHRDGITHSAGHTAGAGRFMPWGGEQDHTSCRLAQPPLLHSLCHRCRNTGGISGYSLRALPHVVYCEAVRSPAARRPPPRPALIPRSPARSFSSWSATRSPLYVG